MINRAESCSSPQNIYLLIVSDRLIFLTKLFVWHGVFLNAHAHSCKWSRFNSFQIPDLMTRWGVDTDSGYTEAADCIENVSWSTKWSLAGIQSQVRGVNLKSSMPGIECQVSVGSPQSELLRTRWPFLDRFHSRSLMHVKESVIKRCRILSTLLSPRVDGESSIRLRRAGNG